MMRPVLVPFAAIAALAASGAAAHAQTSGDGYLFGRPRVTLTVRGGYDRPFAQGGLFDDAVNQLTLGRSAFAGGAIHGELAFALGRRLDLALMGGFASAARGSEYRRFVDEANDSPITQTTRLRRAPVGVGLKAYLAPRGREIGRFAWIPARVSPFVGVGGGAVYYRYGQQGSFVDFRDLQVIDGEVRSSGWAPAGFASAGTDWSLSPRFVLSGELRYTAARGTLSGDFAPYDRINLSGAAANVGLGVRF